ncbi:MAG: UDP-galactopyranose mutase [Ruminococcaceae bacterium]|nr:UDP-galactopyranose mutase [Oscillospiraceae bacterium]
MKNYDYIIVGSGFAGAVCSAVLSRAGKSVLVLEKRSHIGGNAYDCKNEAGILIHKYGPHIFHTDSKRVYDFLCGYTDWYNYSHEVLARAGDIEFPVPFNLNSLYKVYGEEKAKELEEKLISSYGPETKISIAKLRKSADKNIRELAEFVYENVFLHYTIKQWGKRPEEIDPETTARVPIFISRDNRYFQDKYQGLPKLGYTPVFEKMLGHDNINVMTSVNAKQLLSFKNNKIFFKEAEFEGKVIYTGALDELFDYEYGPLPYRTLEFKFENHPVTRFQSHATINYTHGMPYTRITEFKLLTGQKKEGVTSIVKEYSKEYSPDSDSIPYYAIINKENNLIYQKYAEKARTFNGLLLLGRLAEYKYYNMDKIILLALELCDKLLGDVL